MCTSNNFYHSVIILSTPYTYEINNKNNNFRLALYIYKVRNLEHKGIIFDNFISSCQTRWLIAD